MSHHHQTETIHNGSYNENHSITPVTPVTSKPPEITDREWSNYLYSHKNCWNPPYYDNHSDSINPGNHGNIDTHTIYNSIDTYGITSLTHGVDNAFSGPSGFTTNL